MTIPPSPDPRALFGPPSDGAPYFLALLKPSPGLFARMNAEDEAAIAAHFAYLKALLDLGRLVIAGPAGQPPAFGIIVFRADTPAEARAIAEQDPAITTKTLLLDQVLPFSLALERGDPV